MVYLTQSTSDAEERRLTVSVDAPAHDDTRARILKAALHLFAEHGFAGTSTREISERLGFTKAALYYHFRTKDDLLAAIVTPVLDDLARLVSSAAPGSSATVRRAVLADYVDLIASNDLLSRVLMQDPSVAHHPALAQGIPIYRQLTELLSGQQMPGTAAQTRVRAALGGIRDALFYAAPTDDPAVVRAATLAAACGALGIPAPRQA